MRARVEPGEAAAEKFDLQLAPQKVLFVDVGDFQFASCAGSNGLGDGDDVVVVEVEACDGIVALGLFRFFLQREDLFPVVEFDDAVALGIFDLVAEDDSALFQ